MRSAAHTYLVHKTRLKQKAITLRIPLHVHEALNATRERADGAGFVFDIQGVVVEALERAVERVMQELQALESGDQDGVKAPEAKRARARKVRASEPEATK
jgi:hypothetical protein